MVVIFMVIYYLPLSLTSMLVVFVVFSLVMVMLFVILSKIGFHWMFLVVSWLFANPLVISALNFDISICRCNCEGYESINESENNG